MILEVILWPESQKVAETPGWFFINGISDRTGGDSTYDPIGSAAYARILDEDEYTLTRDTKKVRGTSVPVYKEGDARIVEKWICSICGKDTYDIDWQYIGSGTNHLDCELKGEHEIESNTASTIFSDKWLQKKNDDDLIVGIANNDD